MPTRVAMKLAKNVYSENSFLFTPKKIPSLVDTSDGPGFQKLGFEFWKWPLK